MYLIKAIPVHILVCASIQYLLNSLHKKYYVCTVLASWMIEWWWFKDLCNFVLIWSKCVYRENLNIVFIMSFFSNHNYL
jgi:hypothetical protein